LKTKKEEKSELFLLFQKKIKKNSQKNMSKYECAKERYELFRDIQLQNENTYCQKRRR
jgi:hypothetical protein